MYKYFQNLEIPKSQSFSYYNSDYFFISLENLQINYKIFKDYIDNIDNNNYEINIDKLKSIGNETLTNFDKELNYFKRNFESEDEKYREIDKLELFFDTYKDLFSIYKINDIKTIEKNEEKIRNLIKKINERFIIKNNR